MGFFPNANRTARTKPRGTATGLPRSLRRAQSHALRMSPDIIEIEETPERIRVAWDNRRVRKDRGLLWFLAVFWMLWAPLTVFITHKAAQEGGMLWAWCVFGWAGTLLIPLSLGQTRARERVEMDARGLTWELSGCFPAARKAIPLAAIAEIRIGAIYKNARNQECVVTLNIFEIARFEKRHLVGHWLHPDHKGLVFERLRRFAAERAWPIRFTDGRVGGTPRG